MKLHAVDIVRMHGTMEAHAILGFRHNVVAGRTFEMVRMQEIETATLLEAVEQLRTVLRHHVVPAHMWKPRGPRQHALVKTPDPPVDPAQTCELSFFAGLCQDLHANADAENGHFSTQ